MPYRAGDVDGDNDEDDDDDDESLILAMVKLMWCGDYNNDVDDNNEDDDGEDKCDYDYVMFVQGDEP